MSLHRSLKTKAGALEAHRNVLTRPERIAKLSDNDRFVPGENEPIHLPKVANVKIMTKKKKAAKTEEGAEETKDAKKGKKK